MASERMQLEAIEELRKRNVSDNKEVLQRLMQDLKKIVPERVRAPPRQQKRSYKRRTCDIPEELQRRNPARAARYSGHNLSPARTRSRSGSLSSRSLSTSSSPDKLVVRFGFFGQRSDRIDSDEDSNCGGSEEQLVTRRKIHPVRDDRSAADITEEDLSLVAMYVSEKKYDSFYGSSCHQCRQKTNDMKTICRSGRCYGVRGQFCGPCLLNRYGENAKEALKNPDWECPPCRGICNCSFCRKKQGKSCTGILIHLAREHGFSDVNAYLQSLRKK